MLQKPGPLQKKQATEKKHLHCEVVEYRFIGHLASKEYTGIVRWPQAQRFLIPNVTTEGLQHTPVDF